MDVKCPHCGTEYDIEQREFGKFVNCQICGKGFVAGASARRGSVAANKNDNAQIVPYGNSELKYVGIFLLYGVVTILSATILGMLLGFIVGGVMGMLGCIMDTVVGVCSSLGVVVGFVISAICFRHIVLRFLDKEHCNQCWAMPWLSLIVLSAVVGFLFKIVASVNVLVTFAEIGVQGVGEYICIWFFAVIIEYLVFRLVLTIRYIWMNYLIRFSA